MELREIHTGQVVYPIEEESDAETIVAMCNGEKVKFDPDDLETLPLSRCIAA